jgi:hypothetical protein
MLIDGAHQHTEWSNGFVTSSTGRNNWILANAETSEVTRSLLMAGADRRATFGSRTYAAVPNSGGLDVALGAGLLDVYSSYHMLAAGEQESVEAGGGDIKMYGFDYQPSIITLQSKKYRFSIDSAERDFAASLNWNMKIDWTQSGTTFTAKPRVSIFNQPADLDLELYDVSGAVPVLIADSSGNLDTTENIYVANLGPGDYELRVNYALTPWGLGVDGAVDYGLAWRFAPSAAPLAGDVNLDGVVNLSDMAAIQAHLGMTKHAVWTDGDLNLDGRVDRRDLGRFRLNLAVPNVSPVAAGAPIPEPASFFSLLTGAAMAFAFRRCKLGSNRFDA